MMLMGNCHTCHIRKQIRGHPFENIQHKKCEVEGKQSTKSVFYMESFSLHVQFSVWFCGLLKRLFFQRESDSTVFFIVIVGNL